MDAMLEQLQMAVIYSQGRLKYVIAEHPSCMKYYYLQRSDLKYLYNVH